MSGGEFDYQNHAIGIVSRAITDEVEVSERGYSDATRFELLRIARLLAALDDLAHQADLFYSCDISEETFLSRCKKSWNETEVVDANEKLVKELKDGNK